MWLQEIHFSQETKDWLGGLQWPQSAYVDFDKIRKHNEKVRRMKGLATAP